MHVYSTNNLMVSEPTVEVRIEWDEWEGAPTDRDAILFAAGAAARHTYQSTGGGSVKGYTVNGREVPTGTDDPDTNGMIVWVTVDNV